MRSSHFFLRTMAKTRSAPAAQKPPPEPNATSDSMNSFQVSIEKLVGGVESREDSKRAIFDTPAAADSTTAKRKHTNPSDTTLGGPLLTSELSQLSLMCSESANENQPMHGLGALDGGLLTSLVALLEKHVSSAASVNLIQEAYNAMEGCKSHEVSTEEEDNEESKAMTMDEWLKGANHPGSASAGQGTKRIQVIRNGLEAASVLISIMTSPGIDRRVASEDCIEACIALFRQHLSKNMLPAIGNTGHLSISKRKDDSAAAPDEAKPSAKKSRSNSPKKGGDTKEQCLVRDLKKLYKHILSTSGLVLTLLERMEELVGNVALDDRPLLTLCGAALSVFPVDPATLQKEMSTCRMLQISSIALVTTIFQKYPQHRAIIIEDLFPIMRHLPSSKRSLRTFSLRTDNDSVSIKRTLFSGTSGVEGNHCIQAMTALIVSLVQTCVEMPTVVLPDTMEDDGTKKQEEHLRSGVASCQAVCSLFVSQLLQRCSQKGRDGGASEFRPILTNLLDDLLFVQLLPDHPAAEMILFFIFHMLSKDVMTAKAGGKTSTTIESTYLATAFDAMGKISAAVARLFAMEREDPFTIARFQPDASVEDGPPTDASRCPCGRKTLVDTFMVNCDECQSWFHGECVGLTKESVSKVWVCNECTLRRIVEEETKLFASRSRQAKGRSEPTVTDTHVFRQLALNYLYNQAESTSSSSVDCARKFYLAKWVKELDDAHQACMNGETKEGAVSDAFESKLLRDHFLSQWDAPSMESLRKGWAGATSAPCLDRQGNLRATRTLLVTTSDLARSFPRQMGLFVQLMEDEAHVSLRKLAVKAISQVVEMDPTLMLQPAVTKAVSQRFRDDAKSVREAAVALVGSFVLQTPEVANTFHSSLLPCLTDAGVSVKKRAVRIFRDILQSNPSYRGRAAACAVMLRQAADPKEDDSVRDLIYELFTEMWLVGGQTATDTLPKLSARKSSKKAIDVSDQQLPLVTPLSPGGSSGVKSGKSPTTTPKTRCQLAAEQMVEVTLAAGTKDVVTSLMQELMFGLSAADADKDRKASEREGRKEALHKHSSNLVDALIEHLLRLEESRKDMSAKFGPKLVASIQTLGVFAQVAPAEVLRHGDILLPYLKADNGVSPEYETLIVAECCDIISQMISVMKSGDIVALGGSKLCDDLVRITYRFGSSALNSAVSLLSALANHSDTGKDSHAGQTLLKLVQTFYGYLSKSAGSADSSKVRSNVKRALSVLGSFTRSYCQSDPEWGEEEEMLDVAPVSPEDLSWSNVSRGCFTMFMEFLQKPDIATKCAALRALTGIFIARPRILLMLEQDGTIKEIMSSESPADLQLEALRCWKDILLAEEKRLESGHSNSKMESDENSTLNQQISGDQDGDATLIGGVLTQHAERLFQLTASRDDKVRLATVGLLGQLLRQGLLNPMDAVPHLFALQGDVQQPQNRSMSLKLLIAEAEKRPDMIRQRVCAGVKQAYIFQRAVYPAQVDPTAVVRRKSSKTSEVESIFSNVFVECIRSSKKQRHGLYLTMLTLFDIEDHSHHPSSPGKSRAPLDLPLLSFAAEVLAHLPYNTAGDPLFLIHHISSIVALQGAQLADRIAEFLRPYGLASEEHDDPLAEEDAFELAARNKSPSHTKEISFLNKSKFDLARFADFCSDASAITLLLRLKTFLRKTYNLSEIRCLEYSPDSRERSYDKTIATPSSTSVFDSKLRGFSSEKSSSRKNFDKDGLIVQYAEYRSLMRAEHHAADVKMSDSEEDATTTTTNSGRKRKNSEASAASAADA